MIRRAVLPLLTSALVLAGLAPVAGAASAQPAPVATLSKTPWEIAPLPTGGAFSTQRDGDVVYLDASDQPRSVALPRSAITSVGQFLGLALAPDFTASHLVYLCVRQSIDPDGPGPANATNSVWRLRADGSTLSVVDRVFAGMDSAGHDGGRIVFGPDGMLYVTTGDIHQGDRPQNLDSLNGKILRLQIGDTGPAVAPGDNPFVTSGGRAQYVWSYGHRHPQGLAFDSAGRLWESEHGPSGEKYAQPTYPGANGQTGRDEINLIFPGGNYGWPLVSGAMTGQGLIPPKAVAGDVAWAPGDLAFGSDGALYAPFLVGEELRRFDLQGEKVVGQATVLSGVGRLRVAVARGDQLLVAADDVSNAPLYRLDLPYTPASLPATPESLSLPPASAPPADLVPARTQQLADAFVARLVERGRRGLLRNPRVRVHALAPEAGSARVTVGLAGHGVLGAKRFALSGAGDRGFDVRLTHPSRLRGVRHAVVVVRVVLRTPLGRVIPVERRVRLPS